MREGPSPTELSVLVRVAVSGRNLHDEPRITTIVTRTVDDLRNEIREAVGRHERIESTAFTKEALAAICGAVGYEIEPNGFPSKAVMRAGILRKLGELDADDPDETDRPFRKTELESIAAALRTD